MKKNTQLKYQILAEFWVELWVFGGRSYGLRQYPISGPVCWIHVAFCICQWFLSAPDIILDILKRVHQLSGHPEHREYTRNALI